MAQAFRSNRAIFETLERRALLSTSIPLNTTNWTFMGPAPLTDSGVTTGGRITGVAAHPTDANTYYIATASGGVWKTTNAGINWSPLTDTQATMFIGSIALAKSNPSIVYAGTGEANWGPTKMALRRDNIYYGLGVLKSIDGGASWSLLGTSEFNRRTIGHIIVHPTDPNIVYLSVGAPAHNGLAGNTGIWKSIDGGASWTNTTTSISTTAAFSDLLMDPTNSSVLWAAVGDPDGDIANGIYRTTNAGTSWSPVPGFTLQGDSRLGRITLAMAPSNNQVVYVDIAASGQSATTAGAHFQMLRTINAGTSFSTLTLPAIGASIDYNIALAVDPSNSNIAYVAGQSGSGSIRKTTDGGAVWSSIGTGGQAPHPDHHALVFAADGKLLDGNDGGIWRLDNPTVGSISWSSRNGDVGSIQLVGMGLNPINADIAYGGAQDNGTEKFNDSRVWPIVRGGDGGVIRVDHSNPNTFYHTFFYSGAGFLERSDNAGVNWFSVTNGINVADPAYFYPPYVMDPAIANRLILGTNRVYQSFDRADTWNAISAPNTNGWTSSDVIDALGLPKSSSTIVYASAGGKIFVTTNNGASWSERSIPGLIDHYDDFVIDPTDANVAYVVRDRFGGGHVFRTIDAGVNWTDISSNLPDIPATAVELDVRGPGFADDILYVGTDTGVYRSIDQGGSWSVMALGLPRVQIRELEYQKNLGILAAGTHGRGMWQISVPDITAPQVVDSSFAFATAPHTLNFRFSESVNASLAVADLTLQNLTNSTTVPSANIALAYDARTDTATFTFPGFAGGILPDGRYRATLTSAEITDGAGNPLNGNSFAGNFTFDFFFLTGDANHDAQVNLADFNAFAANFGLSPRNFTQGDFNYDTVVNLNDFNLLAGSFGNIIGPGTFASTPIGQRTNNGIIDDILA